MFNGVLQDLDCLFKNDLKISNPNLDHFYHTPAVDLGCKFALLSMVPIHLEGEKWSEVQLFVKREEIADIKSV
jgi:hypothetical protein